MRLRLLPALAALPFLSGCAGYAADYWKPKENIITPQLARFGLADKERACVAERLKTGLTVWQLRQLADTASRLRSGGNNPASFSPRDLVYVAGLAQDPAVGKTTREVLEACGAALAPATVASAPATAPSATPALTPGSQVQSSTALPEGTPGAAALWLNLGTAPTGQAIAVDASSITNGTGFRQAWFRLSNPGQTASDIGYLLRIQCAQGSMYAMGGRKYDAAGKVLEQKDYPPPGQGPLAVETGTVMEIAFRAMCS